MFALVVTGCGPVKSAIVTQLPSLGATPAHKTALTPAPMSNGLVNLAHLNFLSEPVEINGVPMILTHIYSEFPRYEWVDASGEGLAAVDDVARATLVYLDYYQSTKDPRALESARRGLNFVRSMQATDGSGAFYNFVTDHAGTINQTGITSYKSLDWWAMRGMWALARGYATFKVSDPTYAATLRKTYLRTERALAASITNAGKTTSVHGFAVPAWLPGGAADRTAVAVLALAEFQQAEPNDDTAKLLSLLADGIAAFQLGGPSEYPFSMHPDTLNAPGLWHAWGSHQAQALAFAGRVMKNDQWIESAAREAHTFFSWQLTAGMINKIGTLPAREGQIAYGVNTMVQAFMNLYHVTNDPSYARMGGLTAAWFFGNNYAQTPMYDPQTGRAFDGIDAALKVNQNSGAESTIEALMAMQAVSAVPEAARYLHYKAKSQAAGWQVIEAESGAEIAGKPTYGKRDWTGEANISNGHYYELHPGDIIEVPFEAPASGDYGLYVSHMRRAPPQPELSLEAIPARQVKVDALFDEWSAAPKMSSDQPSQLLRGAQFWRGPDQDSNEVRTMWDADNLYLAIAVRDSLLGDEGTTGPSGADAVWVYVDGRGDGNRLSAKFTLGHTDKGGQAWDWLAGFWLPKAQVAWQQSAGGYMYEAAIPWASIGVREAKLGQRLGIEIGRSVGGNSFLNLSGRDPDSASNLVSLMLVEHAGQVNPLKTNPSALALSEKTDAVAFSISISNTTTFTILQALAPDRDYLWLDRVNAEPLRLAAGPNHLRIAYAGSDPNRAALVDAFLLMPSVITREFSGPNNEKLILRYDMSIGTLAWEE